jgi:hypothetical protein
MGPMMRRYASSLVIIASTLAITAIAPAQQTMVHYHGIGSNSCASFLGAVKGTQPGSGPTLTYPNGQKWFSESGLYAEWIQGFITAINVASDDSHQISADYPGVDLWLRNWCQAHPADLLGWAVSDFARAMHAR